MPQNTNAVVTRVLGRLLLAFILGMTAALILGACSVLPQHVPNPQEPTQTDARYLNSIDTASVLTIKPDGTYVYRSADTTKTGAWQRDTVSNLEVIRFDSTCTARLTRLWIHDQTNCLSKVRSWKQNPVNYTFP